MALVNAIRVNKFGPPDSALKLQQITLPPLTANQVLVKVEAVGVNPVETYIRNGTYPRLPSLPYTPGNDCSGVVEAVGENVKRVKVGDRVYTSQTVTGSYAELAVAFENTVHPFPKNISFSQAAALNVPYSTAYHALFQIAHAKPGETLLIHGASGGVGIPAIQLALSRGLIVIGTAGTDHGKKLLQDQGVSQIVNHNSPNHFEEILSLTNGRGVDIILEMLANVNLAGDLKVLAQGGRVAVVGSRGPIQIDPRDTMSRRTMILGVNLNNATEAESREIHAAIYAGLSNSSLSPVVGATYPLANAAQAHKDIINPPAGGAAGKIVLLTH